MVKVIAPPARCGNCHVCVTFDPGDVRQQRGCGPAGCGLFNVVTCPKCGKAIQISKVQQPLPPGPPPMQPPTS